MSRAMAINRESDQEGFRWRSMLVLSLLLHAVLFSAFFLVPWHRSGGLRMNEVVYEVNLVDMSKYKSKPAARKAAARPTSADNKQAKRISTSSRQKNAVNVPKRNARRIKVKPKKDQGSSNQLLDQAISRIDKKVKTDNNTDYIDRAIAELDKKAGSTGRSKKGSSVVSMAMNMYKRDVDALIKSHWSYSDTSGNQEKLEATVLVKISKDGTVLETGFIRSSGNDKYDESVLKTIEKAKPLLPLPEEYKENYGEIEIDFILKDLE